MKISVQKTGFTLIELLVVIAIIGTLASVVLASLNSAREKSRNAAMLATIKEVQKGLELYYSTEGSYPIAAASWACIGEYTNSHSPDRCWTLSDADFSEETALRTVLAPYIDIASISIPNQSTSPHGIMYGERNGNAGYELIFVLEGDNQDCGSANRRREASSVPYGRTNGSTACVVCVNFSSAWCNNAY